MYAGAENTLTVTTLKSKLRFVAGNEIRGFGSAPEFAEEVDSYADLVLTQSPWIPDERDGVTFFIQTSLNAETHY